LEWCDDMYDIAIIGAGPAGATLARLAGKRYRVLLVDRRRFAGGPAEGSGTKCCGGLLAPDAQKMMAALGLGLPREAVVGPQLFTVRTIDLQAGLERYYQRFYINVDREKFDRWLLSMVPGSVEMRLGAVFKSLERNGQGFKITLLQDGKRQEEQVRAIIGADGAFSMVRRIAFPGLPLPEKYIAVQEWFQSERVLPYFTTVFDSSLTNFYCWTIPKEGCLIVGAALAPDNQAAHRFELLKERLGDYGLKLGRRVKREGSFILRPEKLCHINTGSDGVALLGEAAGLISPSSAEGISYALRSAMLCARSLEEGTGGFAGRYSRNTGQMRRNIFIKNLKSPFMYTPALRKMVMKSGLLSMDVQPPILL